MTSRSGHLTIVEPDQSTLTDDLSRAADLLERDVERTLGPGHRDVIDAARANAARLDIVDRATKLVEDVQQEFHDTFVDTTWPACPRHRRHPLWYERGAWWCTQDHEIVASLGELVSPLRSAGE